MDCSELVPPMRKSSSLTSTTLMTSAFCILLGAFVFIATSGYPSVHSQGFGRGPAFYPRVLAGLMIFIGVLTLIRDIRHARRAHPAEPAAESAAPPVSCRPVAVFLILCAASIFAMKYLGFLLSGFLLAFLATLMIRASLKSADVVRAVVFSFGLMALVYFLFEVFVGIQLPVATIFK